MNEHVDYYKARLPEPFTILGLKLRPFSFGHLLLLHRIESYFVGADSELTYEDLALSVLICSMSYRDAIQIFDDKTLPKFMARWADRLTGRGILATLRLRTVRTIPLHVKAADFASYMASGKRRLTYLNNGESRELGLPDIQIVRVTLLREFGGLTDEALMDRPWGLCEEDFVTIHALDDKVTMHESVDLTDAREAAKKVYDRYVKPQKNGAN